MNILLSGAGIHTPRWATARKMLKVIYWMLRNNEPFPPGPVVVDPVAGRRED